MTSAASTGSTDAILRRVQEVVRSGEALRQEGVPFDVSSFVDQVRSDLSKRDLPGAMTALRRAEGLLEKTQRDWNWLKGLLARVDELRDLAGRSGVDLEVVDQRIGNARQQLKTLALADGALEKAAASASLALVVLNDTLPRYYTQEAQQLARSIREARERGEDVREAGAKLSQLLQAIREGGLSNIGQRFQELKRAVTRIPRAPAIPTQMGEAEEEEILLEARNLARRLNRMKYRARDAQGAARLMAQVRAALSEDRRYGSPEEELEELWGEVGRLARERVESLAEPATPAAEEPEDDGAAPVGPAPSRRAARRPP